MNKVYIKKVIKMFLIICAMTMLFCIPADAAASTSVKALKVGKTYNITDASNVTTTKPAVASVTKKSSKKYTISALKKGRTTLKVYNSKGKVAEKIYLIAYKSNSFKYDTDPISLNVGSTKKVQATVQTGCTVKYTSSDKSIAKVNKNGKITAVSAGTATISAKVFYKDTRIKTLKKEVTVKEKKSSSSSSSSDNSSSNSSSSDSSNNSSSNESSTSNGTSSSTSSDNATTSESSNASGNETAVEDTTETEKVFKNHLGTYPGQPGSRSANVKGGYAITLGLYCEKASDIVTFELSNNCLELVDITYWEGYDDWNDAYAYETTGHFYGRREGTCTLTMKLNGEVYTSYEITVTSDDANWLAYQDWKPQVIEQIWDDSMSELEKIVALVDYIYTNYTYYTASSYLVFARPDVYPGGDCIAAADLLVDFAKEFGCSGEDILFIPDDNAGYNHHAAKIFVGDTFYVIDLWMDVVYGSEGWAVYKDGQYYSSLEDIHDHGYYGTSSGLIVNEDAWNLYVLS